MRRTRLTLAASMMAVVAVVGLPATAYAAPASETPVAADATATEASATDAPAADGTAATSSADAPAASTAAEPTAAEPTAAETTPAEPSAAESAAVEPSEVDEAAPEAAVAAAVPGEIPVQLVAMNDFHGRISTTTAGDSQLLTSPGPDGAYGTTDDVVQTVGGSANVATTVRQTQAAFGGANSFFVGAGDLISASPFESSVFLDEPTIEVLNAMGLDVSSVGNHEFDRGTQELRRISAATDGTYTDDVSACEGVTPGVDGCFTDSTGAPFAGTDYEYLAANVVSKSTGQPILPPYQTFDLGGGQQMALIGIVTDTTPTLVSPTGIADVTFADEATTINYWTGVLQAQGIQSIGVLMHEGGLAGTALPPTAAYNGCADLTGPIVDINAAVVDAVDFIVTAHSHQAYNCTLPVPGGQDRLVTQAGYYGRLVTDIRLSVDPTTGDVDRTAGSYSATNIAVTRANPAPDVQAIVDYWTAQSNVAGDVSVGSITGDILRAGAPPAAATRDAESSLGNFVADSQLAALQADPANGAPVVAFMNPGGLRTDLAYASTGPNDPDGNVTYRELFNVQPFGNTVNSVTLTGAGIRQLLEEQFPSDARTTQLILGTSEGFSYSYDPARPVGDKVDPCSITIDGVPVDPAASYRVVANSFLVAGGDSFTAFLDGTDPVTGPVDVDSAVSYLAENSPVSPPAVGHGVASTDRLSCGATTPPVTTPVPPVTQPTVPVAQPVVPVAQPVTAGGGSRSTSGGRTSLAYTGADIAPVLGLGALLVLTGGVATVAGYRRRHGLAERTSA